MINFSGIPDHCKVPAIPPAVTLFTADFERGIWKGIREVFPGAQIHRCVFHWSKAVYTKVQEHGLQVNINIIQISFNLKKFDSFYA